MSAENTINTAQTIAGGAVMASGHAAEVAGRVAQSLPCPVARTVGSVVERAGRAASDAAVSVVTRDKARVSGK